MSKDSLTWNKIPRFELYSKDLLFNKFECISEGSATLVLDSGEIIEIDFPIGWITDITSTPSLLRGFLSQIGMHSPLSLIHDRLLDMELSRKIAYRGLVAQSKHTLEFFKISADKKYYKKIRRDICRMMIGIKLYDVIIGDRYRKL